MLTVIVKKLVFIICIRLFLFGFFIPNAHELVFVVVAISMNSF